MEFNYFLCLTVFCLRHPFTLFLADIYRTQGDRQDSSLSQFRSRCEKTSATVRQRNDGTWYRVVACELKLIC